MFEAKELREKRLPLVGQIQQLRDRNQTDEGWTDEDNQQWDRVNKEYNDLTRQIEVAERAEAVAVRTEDRQQANQVDNPSRSEVVTEDDRCKAFQGWLQRSAGARVTAGCSAAAERVGLDLNRSDYVMGLPRDWATTRQAHEQRQQSAGTDSAGGYAVPETMINAVELAMLQFGNVAAVADVITTDGGGPLKYPTVNDTGNSGTLEGENDALASTDITFGETQLDAYIVSSDIIKSSVALLEDEEVNLVQVISDILAERIARKENALLTTGTGSSQHNGVVTASAVGKTTAGATAITADEVIDLFHSVDPSYRTGANWMMHDNIALYLRKLKDGDNQYLWSPGLQSGLPDRMLGAPVSINQDMQSSVATATKTVLFGDFKKYKVRRVRQLRFRRLTELYAGNDQEGFVAVIRSDGDLLNAGTNPVKHMLQA
jgi:HK97 family phage major capsid protein